MTKEGYQPIKTKKTTKITPPNTGSHVIIKTDNTETLKNALNRIADLEEENTELKKACDETQELLDKQIEATYKLDKENAELKKDKPELCNAINEGGKACVKLNERLTKAKDLIRNLLRVTYGEGWNYSLDIKVEAEQFLKESE